MGFFPVPTDEEIAFVLDIIEQIGRPALQVVETLLANSSKWDNIARNDFCRSVPPLLTAKT
jgi:proteasome activator subunit 4